MPLRGPTIGHAYVKIHGDGRDLDDDVKRDLKGLEGVYSEAGERDANAYNSAWEKEFKKGLTQLKSKQTKEFRKELRETTDDISRMLKRTQLDIDKTSAQFEGMNKIIGEAEAEIDKQSDALTRLENSIGGLGDETEDTDRKVSRFRRTLEDWDTDGFRKRADSMSDSIERFGDKVGKSFGRGSRNNFINFIGAAMRGLTQLGQIVPSIMNKVSELSDIFTEAGGGAQGLSKVFGSLLKSGGSSIIGIIALMEILSTLGSALAGVAGLVTALAASLSFALVGALGAVAGAMVPVALGIGVLILGLKNLDKQGRQALKPITDGFKDLGKAAGEALSGSLSKNAGQFAKVIRGLEPLVRKIAGAIGDVAGAWADMTKSPAFQQFITALENHIPGMIRTIGDVVGNLGAGFAGVFRAMIPLVEDFLGWLSGVTEEFGKWANSVGGQNALKDFFDDAGDSAAAVGDFLVQAGEALFHLFDAARGTGDSLFRSMADAMGRFSDYLTDPKNQDSIEEFFDFVKKFGEKLGEIGLKIIDMFKELDSKEGRNNLMDILGVIEKIIVGITKIIHFWNVASAAAGKFFDKAQWDKFFKPADDALQKVQDRFRDAPSRWSGRIESALSRIGQLFTDAGQRWKTRVTSAMDTIGDRMKNAPSRWDGRVRPALSKIGDLFSDAGTRWKNRVSKAVDGIGGLFKKMKDVHIKDNVDIGGVLKKVQDSFPTAGEILKRISKIGIIKNVDIGGVFKKIQDSFPTAGEILKRISNIGVIRNVDVGGITQKIFGSFPSAGEILNHIGNIAISTLVDVGGIASMIFGAFPSASEILNNIGSINVGSLLTGPQRLIDKVLASGGVVYGPTRALVGEAGPEAVVPLARPLALVDPAVRALSAFAQGLTPGVQPQGIPEQRPIELTIVTPTKDPHAVALETINRLTAVGY